MDEKLIKVGISQGDSNGVGYEVILKTFSDPRMFEICTPVLYGSQKILSYYSKILAAAEVPPVEIQVVPDPQRAVAGKLNLIRCVEDNTPIEPGQSTESAGKAALQSLNAVVADMKKGFVDGLVTAPINKHNIQSEKFQFPGHTEYLEKKFGDSKHKPLMILTNDSLRVALVTGHVPLAEVKSKLTVEALDDKLLAFDKSLRQDFGIVRPRIAVLSLNPHSGDDGLLAMRKKT